MALLKNITTESGIKVNYAYHTIGTMIVIKDQCEFTWNCYRDRDAYLENRAMISSERLFCTLDITDEALNYARQVYAYLKSEDGYIDALDVLEDGQTPLTANEMS